MIELVATVFISLTTVDGLEISVNAAQITTLFPSRESGGAPNQLMVKGVRCIVGISGGKFISVIEECPVVRDKIERTIDPTR